MRVLMQTFMQEVSEKGADGITQALHVLNEGQNRIIRSTKREEPQDSKPASAAPAQPTGQPYSSKDRPWHSRMTVREQGKEKMLQQKERRSQQTSLSVEAQHIDPCDLPQATMTQRCRRAVEMAVNKGDVAECGWFFYEGIKYRLTDGVQLRMLDCPKGNLMLIQ